MQVLSHIVILKKNPDHSPYFRVVLGFRQCTI